jgi:hypothetical protein
VNTFGALQKQHGDWYLAIALCWKPKKQTQCDGGSRKKSVIACKG